MGTSMTSSMAEDEKIRSTDQVVMGYPAPPPSFYQHLGYASTQSHNESSAGYGYTQHQSTGLNHGSSRMQTATGGGGTRYSSIQPNTTTNIGNNHSFVQIPPTRPSSPPPPQCSNKRFVAWILIHILGVLVIGGIAYDVSKTTLTKIEVNSLSVSSFNASHSQISANWDMNISIFILKPTATNRKNYDRVDVSVYYKNEFLSGTVVGPIQLDSNEQGLFQANVTASSKDVPNSIADSITADHKEHGTVSFNVDLHFSRKGTIGRVHDLGASCKGLGIEFSSDSTRGNMPPGKSRKCKILDS